MSISLYKRRIVPEQRIKATSNFCTYCGSYLYEWEKVVDHFTPIVSGLIGVHGKSNLFVSCRECNAIKSDLVFGSLEEARSYVLPIKRDQGRPIKHKNYHPTRGPENRSCQVCGKGFVTVANKLFCSKECVKQNALNTKGKSFTCEICNSVFVRVSYEGAPPIRTCSKKCFGELHRRMLRERSA